MQALVSVPQCGFELVTDVRDSFGGDCPTAIPRPVAGPSDRAVAVDEGDEVGPAALALLERKGPYAPLLAVAEASEAQNHADLGPLAEAAGVNAEAINRALLAATAWASEVTEYWE